MYIEFKKKKNLNIPLHLNLFKLASIYICLCVNVEWMSLTHVGTIII